MERIVRFFGLMLLILLLSVTAWAVDEESAEGLKIIEAASEPAVTQPNSLIQPQSQGAAQTDTQTKLVMAQPLPAGSYVDPIRYTLGPDDVIQIDVLRHPEFSGTYPVNLEGKIQYKFVGDIDVTGLTKKELEQKIKEIISTYVISPEVNVTILEYKSKVIYVVGEVGRPGKYYMRSDTIPVREAVVEAGLPTLAAAMRRCRLITPDKNGRVKTRSVDLYSILYGGNLRYNLDMHAGDVLYVPATVMAKIVRVINPVTAPIASLNSGEGSATALATRPR